MKYLYSLLVLLLPSLAIADCPESENYSIHSLTQSGFGITSPNCRYQLQVNITGDGAYYLFVGYQSGSFIHNGDETIFNKIPKAEFDDDPYLRGFYRGYMSGELITDIHAAYNQPSPNGTIDLLSYEGDDFLACEDPPPQPGVAISMDELLPWIKFVCVLLGVIAFASSFRVGQAAWDLILRAKNERNMWIILFLVVSPSVASAQYGVCEKRLLYTGHTISYYNGAATKRVNLDITFSDGSSLSGYYQMDQFYGYMGGLSFQGIPYDVYMSDPVLRGLWSANATNQIHSMMVSWWNTGIQPDWTQATPHPVVQCSCFEDPSYGGCPNYNPSGPDVPVYCGDGETVDESPDDPDCGCPGQDYTICDGECPDADGDLCCDEIDPKPDDPSCGCTRAGPTGECEDDCPQCEKLLSDYQDDFIALFEEFGVDVSPLLQRGTEAQPIIITIPAPQFGPFSGHPGWQFGTDETYLEEGPAKTALAFARVTVREILLAMILYTTVFSILRIFFK